MGGRKTIAGGGLFVLSQRKMNIKIKNIAKMNMNYYKIIIKGIIILGLVIFLFLPSFAEARSGCCSWHGGVCGCGCCDGTSLSATCAPYYPSCYSAPTYKTPTYYPPIQTYSFGENTYYSYDSYLQAKADWLNRHKEGIRNLYRTILEREPSNDEVDYWASKESDINKIKSEFLNSDEYKTLQAKKQEQKEQTKPTPTQNTLPNPKESSKNYHWVWWLLGGGLVVYFWLANKKE